MQCEHERYPRDWQSILLHSVQGMCRLRVPAAQQRVYYAQTNNVDLKGVC